MNRRYFFAFPLLAATKRAVAASDKVNVAVIGVRGQGRHLTGKFAAMSDVNLKTLCDVDPRVYKRAADLAQEKSGKRPEFEKDMRRVFDDKEIDAVVIAAPDHWHAPGTILACQAGKDVYVEKPASHNLREGRLMVDAARQHQRIVQLGIQSRSRPSTIRAIELIRSGKIGKVRAAKAWDVQLRDFIGHKSDSPAPAEVDYDTWVGPAPFLPHNENRFHYRWHWHWNFGTGDVGNDGIHQLDTARWALDVGVAPNISGMGRKLFFEDDQQTPDTLNVNFDYAERLIQFELRIWNPYGMEGLQNGVAVYGSDGMMRIGKWGKQWGYQILGPKGEMVENNITNETDDDASHPKNFVACIKSRQRPNADIEIGHLSSSLCHLANVVARTGRHLRFDPAKEAILSDSSANSLLKRRYRAHWATPKGV
jgi:predicted dehydrogenase